MQVVKYEPKAVMKYTNKNKSRTPVMRRFVSIVNLIVGFILCIPFWFHMFFGAHEPYMSLWTMFGVFLVMVGTTMMFLGLFTLRQTRGTSDTTQQDIARIRFATETQLMRDVMNDFTKK